MLVGIQGGVSQVAVLFPVSVAVESLAESEGK